MCGRVRLSSDVSEIKLVFSIPPHRPTPNFAPSWNAAPTDPLPIVRFDARAGERSLDLERWGLVPYWAKNLKIGFANINAKAEGIETRPAFREAFQRRRCLVPVDNFYEWKKTAALLFGLWYAAYRRATVSTAYILRVATLDDDPGVTPAMHIWASHEPSWLTDGKEVPRYPEWEPGRQ